MTDIQLSLPNGSQGDALVLARLPLLGGTVAFDAGDARRVPGRDVLRLRHLFVSHCHVDHFVGFDALVRPRVCRPERLDVAGPEGFLDRVQARLDGYTWNLVEGNRFVVVAREMRPDRIAVASFDSGESFRRRDLPDEPAGPLDLGDLVAESEALDHHVVSQGWSLRAPARANVREAELAASGLPPGRWLADLKRLALAGRDAEPVTLPDGTSRPAGELARTLLSTSPGTRVVFVTDTICDAATRPRIVRLAQDADVFACGAPFLEATQADRARLTRHLSAAQAGRMADEAGARALLLFHVSDRYGGDVARHAEEAHEAAKGRVRILTEEPWSVVEWG